MNITTMNTMRDHRSLFRQLLAGMYDAVIITDPSGHVLELNPRAVEYFGHAPEEAMDRHVATFVPGITPAIVQRLRRGLDEARHMLLDGNCLRKDGSTFTAEVTVSQIDLFDAGDLVFTIRNTDRRRHQLAVLKSKSNAFEVAQCAIFCCDSDGRFRHVNQSFLDLFGYASEDEVQKQNFESLMDDDPLPNLFKTAAGGEDVSIRIKADDDGEGQMLEIRMSPDMQGKRICGVVGSVMRV